MNIEDHPGFQYLDCVLRAQQLFGDDVLDRSFLPSSSSECVEEEDRKKRREILAASEKCDCTLAQLQDADEVRRITADVASLEIRAECELWERQRIWSEIHRVESERREIERLEREHVKQQRIEHAQNANRRLHLAGLANFNGQFFTFPTATVSAKPFVPFSDDPRFFNATENPYVDGESSDDVMDVDDHPWVNDDDTLLYHNNRFDGHLMGRRSRYVKKRAGRKHTKAI